MKQCFVELILLPLFLFALEWIIFMFEAEFFFWTGVFTTLFSLLLVVLAPIVIMPLFYKFEPMKDNLLTGDIRSLADDVSFPLE